MMFTKRLREGVRRGEITCSVRFWMRPRVRVGARVGISGRAGSAEGGEARSKREDLLGAVPLRAAAGEASWEEAGVKTMPGGPCVVERTRALWLTFLWSNPLDDAELPVLASIIKNVDVISYMPILLDTELCVTVQRNI